MENRYDLSGSLLHWYDYNKRLLPWRENKDPYRIWISEIMSQQTRVEAVKPYFDRFMEALPTVYDLAEVEDDRLMKLWEGLGYYNRARNLKAKKDRRSFKNMVDNCLQIMINYYR